MHTHRRTSTYRRAVALAALLLASACTDDQGLGRQPQAHRATTAASAPMASPTTSEVALGQPQAPASATAETPDTTPPTTAPSTRFTLPAPAEPEPEPATTVATVRQQPATVDGLPRQLRRIGGCESAGDPDGPLLWAQPNLQGSTASGAFQILNSTWATWAVRYGAGTDATSYSRAMYAPPTTQVTVVVRAHAAEGPAPWASSRECWVG